MSWSGIRFGVVHARWVQRNSGTLVGAESSPLAVNGSVAGEVDALEAMAAADPGDAAGVVEAACPTGAVGAALPRPFAFSPDAPVPDVATPCDAPPGALPCGPKGPRPPTMICGPGAGAGTIGACGAGEAGAASTGAGTGEGGGRPSSVFTSRRLSTTASRSLGCLRTAVSLPLRCATTSCCARSGST
jgi:hypothetical protein